jgi:tRNA(Ile)-lysidine synthase
VAHFDHGIRPDSGEDRRLVQDVATKYRLPFAYEEGRLGEGTSEEVARNARYAFLERVKVKYGAAAIITAHHQDDLLETAILNLLRGTGRKGLAPLASRPDVIRPLLSYTKHDIRAYAEAHHLVWREDTTNADERYLRNYIRLRVLPRFGADDRAKLLEIIGTSSAASRELDNILGNILTSQASLDELDRRYFSQLPHSVAKELLASWLRAHAVRDFSTHTLERVVVAAKTQRAGSTIDVLRGVVLRVEKDRLALIARER